MAYFSNGTEGDMYEEQWCKRCVHQNDDYGCPIWMLHLVHVGEKRWQRTLNQLIPMKPKTINGIRHSFPGECRGFQRGGPHETPLRPGQVAALKEWRAGR